MIVSRKWTDVAAAGSCGYGVAMMVAGVQSPPAALDYLGVAQYLWGVLLVLSCVGAAIGAGLRTRDLDKVTRRAWSLNLERVCWLGIALACLLFAVGVLSEYRLTAGATSVGWSGFVIATCAGHWWAIRRTAREARAILARRESEGPS